MSLVQPIVNRALRILGVLDANETPPAVDTQTAIVALNALMVRWEADGISLGWAAVAAGSDTLPAPPEAEYGVALAPDVVEFAREGMGRLLADVYAVDYARLTLDLPEGSVRNGSSLQAFERGF